MRDLVDDEVLGTFAVVADPEDVAAAGARGATTALVDRFSVYASYPAAPTSGTRWSPPSR